MGFTSNGNLLERFGQSGAGRGKALRVFRKRSQLASTSAQPCRGPVENAQGFAFKFLRKLQDKALPALDGLLAGDAPFLLELLTFFTSSISPVERSICLRSARLPRRIASAHARRAPRFPPRWRSRR